MKHNIYATGRLQNIEFNDNGVDRSIGVIEPGNYTLTPDREEIIQCLTGSLIINDNQCLPGQGEKGFDSDKQELFDRLSGQYTFRWQRALQAKERGEYVGRAIVKPSQALGYIV